MMKALSLWQPYAAAIAEGHKAVENRTWKQDSIIGERIAIHATQRRYNPNKDPWGIEKVWPDCPRPDELVYGAILATAKVSAIVRITHPLVSGNPWAFGPYCWVLTDIKKLPEPIVCKGKQRLWNVQLEGGEDEELKRQLAALLVLAREHGPTSEKIRDFVLSNLNLPDFKPLAAAILMLVADD
jgi:hypothetical protein